MHINRALIIKLNLRLSRAPLYSLAPWKNPRHYWILDSTLWIPDSKYCIPFVVSRTWILDSNRQSESGFLELYSEYQSLEFQISQAKFSLIPESGFPYVGRYDPYMEREVLPKSDTYSYSLLLFNSVIFWDSLITIGRHLHLVTLPEVSVLEKQGCT